MKGYLAIPVCQSEVGQVAEEIPTESLPIGDQLPHCTVRLECDLTAGGTGYGTGFFFLFLEEGKRNVPAIVTNRHVVRGSQRGRFVLTVEGPPGQTHTGGVERFQFDAFETRWICHPNPDVDLCVFPIAPLLQRAQAAGKKFFFRSFNAALIPSRDELEGLTTIEDIVMIGYPNAIWDESNNRPIVRRGITATDPALNYNGKAEFMIDAACFPGSSGSPVLLYNQGAYATPDGNLSIGNRLKLLGILYAGPVYTAEGEVRVETIPTQQRVAAVTPIPTNLGLVIRSEILRDFDDVLRRIAGPPGGQPSR